MTPEVWIVVAFIYLGIGIKKRNSWLSLFWWAGAGEILALGVIKLMSLL